jgi:hypothetical protein
MSDEAITKCEQIGSRLVVAERERDEARLSLKHALEAECMECAMFKIERDEARAEAARLRQVATKKK